LPPNNGKWPSEHALIGATVARDSIGKRLQAFGIHDDDIEFFTEGRQQFVLEYESLTVQNGQFGIRLEAFDIEDMKKHGGNEFIPKRASGFGVFKLATQTVVSELMQMQLHAWLVNGLKRCFVDRSQLSSRLRICRITGKTSRQAGWVQATIRL